MTKLDRQGFSSNAEQFSKTWSTQTQFSSGKNKSDSKMARSLSSGALLKASSSILRLSPMKIARPLASPNPAREMLRLDSMFAASDARGIKGISMLDWKPQINVRVPRNTGMLAKLASLKALAIKAACQIQEHKFQLQMMRQNHEKALTNGLEVDVNDFLPVCEQTSLAAGNEDATTVEEVVNEKLEDSEEQLKEDAPKCNFSLDFSIECSMASWEPVSLSKKMIVFSDSKK